MKIPILSALILLLVCLMELTQSCRESSARYNSTALYDWEHPDPLNSSDQMLAHSIDTFFQHKVKSSGLNGSVLVAMEGKVIYKHNFGYLNYPKKELLTDSSTFQLASVTKPFTATAVLLLYQSKKLSIDDGVSKYIKGFPYPEITIRQLLDHRSGLANYIYLFDSIKITHNHFFSNLDVVNYFIDNKPALQATPGHRFQYCNSNYALLAYIVEQVSGEKYSAYLKEHIFLPSHMRHTYVRDINDSVKNINQTAGYQGSQWLRVSDVPYDGVTGDKGIYTTATDLYLFDQALNHGLLLDSTILKEAYSGYSYEKPGQKNYGLGWRLKEFPDSSKIIYHNGWWRGYNTLFVRMPEQGTCIIVLANKYNRNVYDIGSLYKILGLKSGEKEENEE